MKFHLKVLCVQLQGLPLECNSSYISVASPASGITLTGNASGTQSTRIPLSLVSGTNTSGKTYATESPVYIFPTTGPTTFSIAYNDAAGEQYASAIYSAPLSSGVPYQLNGNYSDGSLHINGDVTPSQWSNLISLDFNFSNGVNTSIGSTPDTPSTDIVEVKAIPQPFTLWNAKIRTIQSYLFSGTTSTTLTFEEWTSEDPITIE